MTKSHEEILAENEKLSVENEELRRSLGESQELLHAISRGEVDALVVSRPGGDQVFTLEGADRAYRVLIEAMNEGAVTTNSEGTILYCNRRFAEMVKFSLEKVIGSSIYQFIPQADQAEFRALLQKPGRVELTIRAEDESILPVYKWKNLLITYIDNVLKTYYAITLIEFWVYHDILPNRVALPACPRRSPRH
jgi:PAS domain-containing protein